MKVSPYLIFNGNALEAATRYAEVLGGRIENLTHYGDCMPDAPEEHKGKVMHLCLLFGAEGMGVADAEPGTKTTFGNGNIITLNCDSEEQIAAIYPALSEGGEIRCALQPTFFAKQYADFVDRYGVAWCLILE